jgi:hypothetical protein
MIGQVLSLLWPWLPIKGKSLDPISLRFLSVLKSGQCVTIAGMWWSHSGCYNTAASYWKSHRTELGSNRRWCILSSSGPLFLYLLGPLWASSKVQDILPALCWRTNAGKWYGINNAVLYAPKDAWSHHMLQERKGVSIAGSYKKGNLV